MAELYFDGSVWCNVDIALYHVGVVCRKELEPLGLSVVEWYVLRVLYEEDGQKAGHIAEAVGRPATSFTPILDKLESKNLIERRSHPADRRAIKVYLTKQGRALEERVKATAEKIDSELRKRFTDKDWEGFEQMLIKLQSTTL